MRVLDLPAQDPQTVLDLKQVLGLGNLEHLTAQIHERSAQLLGMASQLDKSANPRTLTVLTSPSIAVDLQEYLGLTVTGQAGPLVLENPPVLGETMSGKRLLVILRSNGFVQPLTFGSKFKGTVAPLPTEIDPMKKLYMGFLYEAHSDTLSLLAYANEL